MLNDPRRQTLSSAERFVLLAVEVHIGDHAEGWPTQERIARQTGLSVRQVRRCLEVLSTRGFLHSRIVMPGGELPSGVRTDSVRLVYALGPLLERPAPGQVVRMVDADKASAKGIKDQIKLNKTPPLPPVEPPPPPPASPEPKNEVCEVRDDRVREEVGGERLDEITAVLTYWQKTLWPELRGKLARPDRVAVISERLAEGFTAEELCWTIDAATESTWHQAEGQRQRLTLEVLLKRPEMVSELVAQGRRIAEAREQERRRKAMHLVRKARPAEPPSPPIAADQALRDFSRLFGETS